MLNKEQIRFLKSSAHHLQPVVMIGANGITPGVDKEIEVALNAHELIKIKLGNIADNEQQKMIDHITQSHTAHFIQKIGHLAVFYRNNPEKNLITLPKA